MRWSSICYIVCALLMVPVSGIADSGVSTWYLPMPLSDQNTTIRFEVDSTWHMVRGATSGVSGTAQLSDQEDPGSVLLTLSLPVMKFDTDSSSRDDRMWEVLSADKYRNVTFSSRGLKNHCTPALVLRDGSCEDIIQGELTIRAKTLSVDLPVRILKAAGGAFALKGQFQIRWEDYGVEDPSIFVARLDPVVTIYFETTLGPAAAPGKQQG